MCKVSIIMPVYNVEPYLDDAFKSLLCQSLKDIEIIVINDGSTDNGQEIINKYMLLDNRITCINQTNQGQSAARNTGMKHVNGEYVLFFDSDDLLAPETLEICYDKAKALDTDICIFDAEILYEEGAKPLTWDYDRSYFLSENRLYGGEELLSVQMDNERLRAVVWLQFIRWDYLTRTGLYFYNGIIHEDELFTPQLFLQTNSICYVNRKLVKHRVRSKSTIGMGYSKRNLMCYLTVAEELFKFSTAPIIKRIARYTLERAFYTGHSIPLTDKLPVFMKATRKGYLKYIGIKSILVFWLKGS